MGTRQRALPVGWYPGSASGCRDEIAEFIKGVKPLAPGTAVFGGIVPHAGWYFSGKLAAQVFYLTSLVSQPEVVCVFGGHLGGNSPPLLVSEDSWETPLGKLEMAKEFFSPLQARISCAPESSGDNTIEIQLPMVKHFFPQARLLALRAPHSPQALELGQAVAAIARELKLSLLAFGSTDLTHYGPNYGYTPKGRGQAALQWVSEVNDRSVIAAILSMDPISVIRDAQQKHNACCSGAAAAALSAGMALGAVQSRLLTYATSHDKSPGESFVGYAGIVF